MESDESEVGIRLKLFSQCLDALYDRSLRAGCDRCVDSPIEIKVYPLRSVHHVQQTNSGARKKRQGTGSNTLGTHAWWISEGMFLSRWCRNQLQKTVEGDQENETMLPSPSSSFLLLRLRRLGLEGFSHSLGRLEHFLKLILFKKTTPISPQQLLYTRFLCHTFPYSSLSQCQRKK